MNNLGAKQHPPVGDADTMAKMLAQAGRSMHKRRPEPQLPTPGPRGL